MPRPHILHRWCKKDGFVQTTLTHPRDFCAALANRLHHNYGKVAGRDLSHEGGSQVRRCGAVL
jgi:hypothetical protein